MKAVDETLEEKGVAQGDTFPACVSRTNSAVPGQQELSRMS